MKAYSRYAAEKKKDVNFIDAILSEQPHLKHKKVVVPRQGGLSHTLFIGNEVYKGPSYFAEIDAIDEEISVLKKLSGKGLPVPEVTCQGRDAIYFGMTRIKGIPLHQCKLEISAKQRAQLAEEVVDAMIGIAEALPRENGKYTVHNDLNDTNILLDPKTFRLAGIIDFGQMTTAKTHIGDIIDISSMRDACTSVYKRRFAGMS